MLASEMIALIRSVERDQCGLSKIYPEEIRYFQRQTLSETQGVVYDEPCFSAFHREMEAALKGRMYTPTARKVLNNWYIWAREKRIKLLKIKPFALDADPIQFLIKNGFPVEADVFAREASEAWVEKTRAAMPQDGPLFRQLKAAADKRFADGKRGYTYPYLLKVVAGFSQGWEGQA